MVVLDQLRLHRHPALAFELAIPAGATVTSDLPPVMRLTEVRPNGFTPTLAVTAETLAADVDLTVWVDASVLEQQRWLAGARELDREPVQMKTGAAIRTLAHHASGAHAVTLEQWWTVVGTRGWLVSAACASTDYDQLTDTFSSSAESFRPLGVEDP